MFKKLKELVEKSIYKGNKPSSSRIFSYVMMAVIFLIGMTHISFEIGNAVLAWKSDKLYVPSWQSISVIAMWLTHQLTLMGIYKKTESDDKNLKSNTHENETK